WFFREPEGSRRVNCHVRISGNPNQRYPLIFRDYLREFPMVAASYAAIKKATAQHCSAGGEDAYYDIKDPVTDIIYAAAEQWAETSGWELAPPQDFTSS
ncbi:MAG: GrpB family protein, partial [Verrucomicrobiota bacterium]